YLIVTGVQTCALPIWRRERVACAGRIFRARTYHRWEGRFVRRVRSRAIQRTTGHVRQRRFSHGFTNVTEGALSNSRLRDEKLPEIGRASCRERVKISG